MPHDFKYELSPEAKQTLLTLHPTIRDQLGLLHWHCLSVQFVEDAEWNALVDYNCDGNTYRLTFRSYWDIPASSQNCRYMLMHELLHLVLAPVMSLAESSVSHATGEIMGRLEHAAIVQLTRALSAGPDMVVRGATVESGITGVWVDECVPAFPSGVAEVVAQSDRYAAPAPVPFTPEQWNGLNAAAVDGRPCSTEPGGCSAGISPRATGPIQQVGTGSMNEDASRWFAASGVNGREVG